MTPVGADTLEARLAELRGEASDPRAGLFGPSSMRWRIDREAALFLGAGRALLLQLAHPWVAAAVAQHSRALDDPIGRFHGTFGTVFAMVFGATDDALAACRRLHRRHQAIEGRLASGAPYAANEPAALRWVHATLTDTALLAYGLVLPLADEMRRGYYDDSRRFAACFGLDPQSLPPDWSGFEADWRDMLAGPALVVDDGARAIAARLLEGAGAFRVPAWYRSLTARILPARLRDDFGLPYGPAEARRAERALSVLRGLYPRLPGRLRFVGPYHEAVERLAGRGPAAATRLSNRFWIGRPRIAD